jgi:SAM-dependent methyltransferase
MSLFYKILYQVGFTPWEHGLAQPAVAEQISAMFHREEAESDRPYGSALDLGCGSGIHAVALAKRGWDVTGVDAVSKALSRARKRAAEADVQLRLMQADVTALDAANVGAGFRLVLDFGTVHGLTPDERAIVGQQVSNITSEDATLLMLAFAPGHRAPLPRGMNRAEIEAAYPDWQITDVSAQTGELPWFLRNADPRWYRLRRK